MSDMPAAVDPALLRPRADIGFVVFQPIRNYAKDVRVYEYGAAEGDPGSWIALSSLQVDCGGVNREAAWRLADRCRRRIKAAVWDDFPDVVVTNVVCTDGPRWLPDENGGPRYIARYTVGHHPRQGTGDG
jgi:hypothetical protein